MIITEKKITTLTIKNQKKSTLNLQFICLMLMYKNIPDDGGIKTEYLINKVKDS